MCHMSMQGMEQSNGPFNRLYTIFIMSRKRLMAKLVFTKTGAKASPCIKEAMKFKGK